MAPSARWVALDPAQSGWPCPAAAGLALPRVFVPAVLGLATLLLFAWVVVDEPFRDSFYRAMAVLVAASPCALAIATPSAVLSGVARAARGGVLIKGGAPLELLGSLDAMAFDKTGTLTSGEPRIREIIPASGVSKEELMSIAVAIAAVWFLLFMVFDTGPESEGSKVFDRIQAEEQLRADQHRIQMNSLVKVWENSPILGIAGGSAPELADVASAGGTRYESVNIYFLILARSGIIGLALYLAFILHHLLNTFRLFHEIPASHHRHRILAAGCFASQCAFHVAGLYWATMTEAFSMNLFILVSSMTLYMTEHYTHGLVPDDNAL